MTFSVFPNLRCPGVTKHGQNFESADQDWPDVPGFLSFSYTVHAQTAASFLAHILTDDRIACIDRLFDLSENLFKIGITSAKSSCSKQKNLLFLISTAILMSLIRIPFVRPKSDIAYVGLRYLRIVCAKIIAFVLWQCFIDCISQLLCITR